MIVRIVKLSIKPSNVGQFKEMFKDRKDRIRNFPGRSHLKLLQGIDSENIFFTYSHWNSADDLENYRNSSFFKETWSITKGFFGDKPEAWSVIENVVLT